MKKALKTFFVMVVAISILIAAAGFVYVRFFYFPRVDGEFRVQGLTKRVEIYRGEYGVPHIIAKDTTDAMYGLGFSMAQDRPFQLEIYRRAANGTLSEILDGEEMKQMDRFNRFIRFQELGRRAYENMDSDSQSYVRAFVEGINEGYKTLKGPVPRPFTMVAFGGGPGEWKNEDPMAVGLLAAWMRSANYNVEYFYMNLIKTVGEDKARELLPYYPQPDDGLVDLVRATPLLAAGTDLGRLMGLGAGCSAWCVNRDKSESGESMLVYNAHAGDLRAPAEHYLVHLKGGDELDMAGAAIVGVPGFFAGSNRKIAWALTQDENDATDLYREKINPGNPGQYLFKDEWRDFEVRTEEICYKDGASESGLTCEKFDVRSTVHGPVISDMMPGYESGEEVLSVQWTGFIPDITFNGYVKMAMAQNWNEFRAALNELDISGNHFIFADSEGQIGYQLAGMMPLRALDSKPPLTPDQGWTNDDIWPRKLTMDEMPHLFDPEEGMIASANNRPFNIDGEHHIGSEFSPPHRRNRIYEILSAKDKLTAPEMMDSQKDNFNTVARQIMPIMIRDLGLSDKEDHKWYKKELEAWDMRMDVDSRGALLFESLFSIIARETFVDELGESLTGGYINYNQIFRARFFLMLEDNDNHWFDDTRTEEIETRGDIIRRAADMSLKLLEKNSGPDRSAWSWGGLHTFSIRHFADPALKFMNIDHGPVAGSEQTVNRFGYALSNPFKVTVMPDLRMFVNFDDPDHVRAVIHTGESGWWGHRNYSDQTKMLAEADLVNISMNMDEIKQRSRHLLTLIPAAADKSISAGDEIK